MKSELRPNGWQGRSLATLVCFSLLVATLSACTKEKRLPGIRIDPRVPLEETGHLVSPMENEEIRDYIHSPPVNRVEPVNLPSQQTVSQWSHVNGNPRHSGLHPQLDRTLNEIWSARLGEGNSNRSRINAAPIVAGGAVYAMDSRSQLSAHDLSGNLRWSSDLASIADSDQQVLPGGIAYADGSLFVTTGSGHLYIIDATSGNMQRRQEFDTAVVYPPTVHNGRIFVVTADGNGWAVSSSNDRLLWKVTGGLANVVLSGGVSPAIDANNVIMPLTSGQVVAVEARSGTVQWRTNTGGTSSAEPRTLILGMSGSPVVAGSRIYVATLAGRVMALNASNGATIWGINTGASDTVWTAGNSVFLISDDGKLTRLDAEDGSLVWQRQLPHFIQDNPRRRKGVHVNYGPILAGGRLIVTSSSGSIWEYAPESGELIATTSIPSGAATSPVVANGMLFVIDADGTLHAYR